MNEEVRELTTAEAGTVSLLNSSEINQQIATAHKFPRSIKKFLTEARDLVTLNDAVASECIYALPRDGKVIEGPSARFAEIMAHSWGNSRAGARVVDEQGEFVTAQGVFHDLEKNVAITYEVKRRIVDRNGKRYKPDMIGVTANAACSIALRNAILKGVPKAFWSTLYDEARRVTMGDSKTLAVRRADALAYLQKFGATEAMILSKLGVAGVEEITLEHLVTLRGFATAIKDGDTTVEQAFAVEAELLRDQVRRKSEPAAAQTAEPASEEAAQETAAEEPAAPAVLDRINETFEDTGPIEQDADLPTETKPPADQATMTAELLTMVKDAKSLEDIDYIRSRNAEREATPQSKASVTRSIDEKAKRIQAAE